MNVRLALSGSSNLDAALGGSSTYVTVFGWGIGRARRASFGFPDCCKRTPCRIESDAMKRKRALTDTDEMVEVQPA